jgi:hypothetical protein
MGNPTAFIDDSLIAARALEVPDATWDDGCNNAGSNAPGIGINYEEGAVAGTPEQFTLLDQNGDARTTQASAQIGYEDGDTIRSVINGDGDGTVTLVANVSLVDLSAGWVAGV